MIKFQYPEPGKISDSLKKLMKRITASIDTDMIEFEKEYSAALHSDVGLINTIGNYIIKQRGKRVRPLLTILSSRVCGEPNINSFRAAALIELLHVATLVHDDVVDDADLRRGFSSVNRVWKNKISILMGDYILSKALINMIKLRNFDALELMSETAEKLSSGEILQMEKNLGKKMTESYYYDVIYQKTASLISACCELGAITTTNSHDDRSAMRAYGTNFGMAFQIKDDLFDLLGSENETGKDSGIDVKKNMMTLPLIIAKSNLTFSENRKLNSVLGIKKKSKKDLKEIQRIVEKAGGFDYAKNKIAYYSNKAIEALHTYPDTQYKQSMLDFVAFNMERRN